MILAENSRIRKFGVDRIKVTKMELSPTLLHMISGWTDSAHNVFEALLILTDTGKYGIEITVNELARFAKVSVARVYDSLDFLEESGLLIREKSYGGRKPNKYWIALARLEQFNGELVVERRIA